MSSNFALRSVTGGMGILTKGISGLRPVPFGTRTLFTAEALGVDTYEKQRVRTQTQFTGMVDKFRAKMKEFSFSETKNMIFTEDLKHMVHLIESEPEQIQLINQMMKRFNSQNRHLRFGNFVFGPVVMRMYHFLNEPNAALEVFNDPDLDGFFDQLSSYHILCDLLYKNGMYNELLGVVEAIEKKQVQGIKFPRNATILAFAAYYKLNTLQSYELALKALNDIKEGGTDPVRRIISYAAALALNQNAPQVALEIITTCRTSNYVTIRNLKIWALADLNRPDDALPLLRFSLEDDSPDGFKRHTVCSDVLEKVRIAIEKLDNKEVTLEFQGISKALMDSKQISEDGISSLLDAEIVANKHPVDSGRSFNDSQRRDFDRGFTNPRTEFRPRRFAAYDRDIRQSLNVD